jgi:hypothetical protein
MWRLAPFGAARPAVRNPFDCACVLALNRHDGGSSMAENRGDAEIGRDGVRLMVSWTEAGEPRAAVYWVARAELQQFAEKAGQPNAGATSSEHLFKLYEQEVRQRVLDRHAEKQSGQGGRNR